jgi:hypothetical protein
MKLLMENWRKFVTESQASDAFIKGQDLGLEQFTSLLKQIASDPEFRKLAFAGRRDAAGTADEAISVQEGTPVAAIDLTPTQMDIDTSKSLGDQMTNKYNSTVAALQDVVTMPSPGGHIPLLVFENKYILDGHHRWSQVLMTNPQGKMTVSNLTSPAFGTGPQGAERALKATQLAIAAMAGNVVTKSTDLNLLKLPAKKLGEYVMKNITDDVLQLLVQAGKISQPDRQEAAKYYMSNLQAVQAKPAGKYSREKGMPQADDSGVPQAQVNKALERGNVNFNNPDPQDAARKKAAE